MKGTSFARWLGILALSSFPIHCADDDPVDAPTGTLKLNWTIDGTTDADMCHEIGAIAFEAILFNDGFFVEEVEVPCADFGLTLDILVDDYVVRATLVDVADRAATRRVVTQGVDITEREVETVGIDFPRE